MHDLGVDIVEIARVRRAVERHGAGFRRRVFTTTEWEQCGQSFASLAGRFAAKEAVMKSLGTGGMRFAEIEIVRMHSGQPRVRLYGKTAERAQNLGVRSISISISHSRDSAVAVAFASDEEASNVAVPLY
ncbi:MAG: acpS [Chloroflexi bacterium]|nr:acpS [Chloroflexota bacterium]